MVAEEIVPNIPDDQDYLQKFSKKVLKRYHNPFICHEWMPIALMADEQVGNTCAPRSTRRTEKYW